MSSVIINPNADYSPALPKTNQYKEMNGRPAQSFLNTATWAKAGAVNLLRNRIVSEDGMTNSEAFFNVPVYVGSVNGNVVGLVIGQIKEPLRLFAVANQAAFDSLFAELTKNHGFLESQIQAVGNVLTNNNADGLYAWEGKFFGESKHLKKVWRTAGISTVKQKQVVTGTNAEVLTKGEVQRLVKEVAKKYNIYNLELQFGPFDGRILGYAKPNDDGVLPYSLPLGAILWLNDAIIYKHVVLHELAHVMELMEHGLSGHGAGFRANFRKLIKEYLNQNPVGL